MLALENKYGSMPDYHYRNILSAELAGKILEKIEKQPVYKQIVLNLQSNKVRLYYLIYIRMQIEPYVSVLVRTLKYGSLEEKNKGVWLPPTPIFLLLQECWLWEDIKIQRNIIRDISYDVYVSIKSSLKRLIAYCFNAWNRSWCRIDVAPSGNPTIAVHYTEGLNIKSRSDIVWFPNSGIKANSVIVFIDSRGHGVERKFRFLLSIPLRVKEKLKYFGFRWLVIPAEETLLNGRIGWSPERVRFPNWFIALKKQRFDNAGRWIIRVSEELLNEISRWRRFFESFNVKILFQPEEYDAVSLAQGVAFDLMKEKSGITVSKQRSDIPEPAEAMAGFYSKDIMFSWNERFKNHLALPYNCVRAQIITGHSNDSAFYFFDTELHAIQCQIKRNGAEFIIAIFDSGYGDPTQSKFSTKDMVNFYKYFLGWLLEDTSIGVVIKSKKPGMLDMLPGISALLHKAQETGRCYQFANQRERLPTDAAKIADFAVGAGISSALTEAVISGCRGVHYSNHFPEYHDYYKYGYERLVFTDLSRLLSALKNYKNGLSAYLDLGNWEPYLNLLDPFRDGKADVRMGEYLKWCLEGFSKGLESCDVIKFANNNYAQHWGAENIVEPNIL